MTLDRNHDYLVEHEKRNSIALSSGEAGLSMGTLGTINSYRPPQADC